MAMATRMHVAMYERATPQQRRFGNEWYSRVHDAVSTGIRRRGMSHLAGSALVAAVSPNMDWERDNIDAFRELHSLKQRHWDAIQRSANQPRIVTAEGTKAAPRTDEVTSLLDGYGISKAPVVNLLKAHRIMLGEDPEQVLRRKTAPKTNSFMWDIHDPTGESHPGHDHPGGSRGPYVTVDGRTHDIGANALYPWGFSGRGIGGADLPASRQEFTSSGRPAARFNFKTRYELMEDSVRNAGAILGENPINVQATGWTVGKAMETEGKTLTGEERTNGVKRVGQPYIPGMPQPTMRRRRRS
jgi:hypothetical protein